MNNLCINNVVVTGAAEDIGHFKQTCVRLDEEGESSFDFNSLIPMPEILKAGCRLWGLVGEGLVGDALLVLGRGDLVENPRPLEKLMKSWKVSNIEALKEKIGPKAFEIARQSIEAFEQTGALDRYDWACMNWGTKWNASNFMIIKEEPGRYECRFETVWRPPELVYVELAEKFPNLCFEIRGRDIPPNFDFQATVRYGAFDFQYGDPSREGFWRGMDSDDLLDFAKSYGNDPKRFLCVGLCEAVTPNHCKSKNEDPGCKEAVVAWARGDTKEESENSCREVIARNRSWIETLVTDWQFTVYAPGEIQVQEHAPPEALGVLPATSDDVSDEETENYDCECESCILVEGPAWGDAEFYGKWLLSAAKANDLLQQARTDDLEFRNAIDTLEWVRGLHFGIVATVFLSYYFAGKELQTFVFDSSSAQLLYFVLMAEMGFFVQTGKRYQMTVPEKLNTEIVKQAHLNLAGSEDDEGIHPERFAVDLLFPQAKMYQRQLREMSEDQRLADRRALLFLD